MKPWRPDEIAILSFIIVVLFCAAMVVICAVVERCA